MGNGKLAIVTGASTGIGFELAHIAAKEGYDLLVVADEPLIDAAAGDFQQYGTQVTAVEAPVTIASFPLPIVSLLKQASRPSLSQARA